MAKVISKTKSNESKKPVPKKPDMEKLKKEQEKAAKASEKAGKDAKKAKAIVPAVEVMSPDERQKLAVKHDAEFRALESDTRKNFVKMMVILRDMQSLELWRDLNREDGKKYGGFDQWLKAAAPLSRASGYAALKAAEKVLPFIPQEELANISRRNMDLLSKIPKIHFEKIVPAGKSGKQITVREAAKTQTDKEFRETVAKHVPEAHIEKQLTIKIDASTAPVITDAAKAIQDLGLANENDWLEYMATSWLDSTCELEMYSGMSNRDAARAHKQAQGAEELGQELSQEPVDAA